MINYLDIAILFVLLFGFILGFKDGLVRKIIGILGFALALFLSFKFSGFFGEYLNEIFDDLYFSKLLAGLIIFFVTILIVAVLKRVIHPVDKVNQFVNQLLGGISGIVQIAYILSGIFLFLNIFNFPNGALKEESFLYGNVYNLLPSTIDFILDNEKSADEFIDEYLKKESDYKIIEQDTLNDE